MKMIWLMLVVSIVLFSSTYVLATDIFRLGGSNSNTEINSFEYLPYTPTFGTNLTMRVNVTDNESDNIEWVNFTLISPGGYHYINKSNGTQFGDFWNSTFFQINETGTWSYNVTSEDNITINTTRPYSSGTFTITDVLSYTPNLIEAATNLSVDKVYNIEFWTDSSEDLNFTISHNADKNFTTTLNVSHLVINSTLSNTFLKINISPNSSSTYGNHSYNLTIKRKAPLNRTWTIPIDIEITSNYGDIEFVNATDFTFDNICEGSFTYTLSVINNGNYALTNCHPYLYEDNEEVVGGTNFNLAAGASTTASVTYNFNSGTVITHFGVNCSSATPNGTPDSTLDDPRVTFQEGECGGSTGGAGPSGYTRPVVEVVDKQEETIVERFCGDDICQADLAETPWSCPQDCIGAVFELDQIFCTPVFQCGNWEEAWFINLTVITITGYMVYFMVYKKPGRLSAKKPITRRKIKWPTV